MSKKIKSLAELKAAQKALATEIEARERAERERVGAHFLAVTGAADLDEIRAKFSLIKKTEVAQNEQN